MNDDSIYREYAAMQFYRRACAKQNTTAARWGVLREDLKKKYIDEADAAVEAWATDEAGARVRREQPEK